MPKAFRAETKKYDPDWEEEAEFDTLAEAEAWLREQRNYGLCSMWLNNHRVTFVNDELATSVTAIQQQETIDRAKDCLRSIEKEWREGNSNAVDVMYSLAMQALRHLNGGKSFIPQPTRGTAPQNPATRGEVV